MPPLGRLIGRVNFSDLYINLSQTHYDTLGDTKAHGVALSYGNFINTIINFLIVAFAVFLLVRSVNKWLPKPVPPVTSKDCPQCAMPLAAKKCGHCSSAVQ